MSSQFIRTKEDFVCEKCGTSVVGDGYTNHCPECLWSKHVDVFPGDRAETCRGMMEPVAIENKNSEHVIVHKCTECGKSQKNRAAERDSFQMIIQVAAESMGK